MLHIPARIGALPSSWRWERLDAACSGIYDCPHSTPEITDSGPLVVRTQDVRGGVFKIAQAAHVSEDAYRERTSRAEPRFGDLLYSREGTYFGDAAEVPPGTRVCLGQRMVLLRPDQSRVSSRFLKYWLNSPSVKGHIEGQRDGSVAERLNLPTIRALPVLVPPVCEQQAIAAILGALDDKIDLNRQMNETLEETACALFKSWFVDFDPVRAKAEGRQPFGMDTETAALFPDSFEGSEFGEVPKGWRVGTLSEVATSIRRGIGPSYIEEGGVLVLNQKCVRDHRVNLDPARRHDPTRREVAGRYLEVGDVLVNSTGIGTLGRVAQVLRLSEATIVDSHVTVIRANDALFRRELLVTVRAAASWQASSCRPCFGDREVVDGEQGAA